MHGIILQETGTRITWSFPSFVTLDRSNGEKTTLTQILRDIKDIESSTPDAQITQIMKSPAANDGVLQTALASAKVNQVSTSGFQGKNDNRGKSPGRSNGYGKQNFSRQYGRDSSMSRTPSGSRNYSRNNYKQNSFKNNNSGNNRPRSPSPFTRGSSPRSFGNSNQQKSSGWQASNRQRSASPSQYNTRARSSSFSRDQQNQSRGRSFSRSPGRNDRQSRSGDRGSQSRGRPSYSSSRSGSRQQSPVSFRKQDSNNDKYNKVLYCSRCGSNTHTSGSCFRYKYVGKLSKPCSFCAQNGRQLFHEEKFCRFKQSKYQSPNRKSFSKN